MLVTQVINRGEMFDNCRCASKWKWISVNSNRIGLVGRRCEEPLGRLNSICMCCFIIFINSLKNYKLLRNHKQWHTLQYDEGHFTKEDQLSWKWKFVRNWSLEGIGVLHFMMLPFLILITYFTGSNFRFRCSEFFVQINSHAWVQDKRLDHYQKGQRIKK